MIHVFSFMFPNNRMFQPYTKSTILCAVATAGVLSMCAAFSGNPPIVASAHAVARPMNQYGTWLIVDSNDPLVERLPRPRIVVIRPGEFRIGQHLFGSFRLEPSRNENIFSMKMFNIPFWKRYFTIEPMGVDRMALFETKGTNPTYYILHRHSAQKG